MPKIDIDPDVALTRSRVGVAARIGTPEDLANARRDHTAAKLADYIKRTVDAAPPLTDEQRHRLAALLKNGAAAQDGAS